MNADGLLPTVETRTNDRRIIRVDLNGDRMGIAAALREAFAAAAHDPSTHDFEQLLNDLN